ncbi:hypothetical protein P7C71_g5409, partial [Lecanoromycetidae sp. Uapishka_2]
MHFHVHSADSTPELRLKIYRNLLLEPDEAFLHPKWHHGSNVELENAVYGKEMVMNMDEYDGDFYEHNHDDSGSERDERYVYEAMAQIRQDFEDGDTLEENRLG